MCIRFFFILVNSDKGISLVNLILTLVATILAVAQVKPDFLKNVLTFNRLRISSYTKIVNGIVSFLRVQKGVRILSVSILAISIGLNIFLGFKTFTPPSPTTSVVPPSLPLKPPTNSLITCYGTISNLSAWMHDVNHGYSGPAQNGKHCQGDMYYALPHSGDVIPFFSQETIPAGSHKVDIWIYIPNDNAGAVATYTLQFFDTNGNSVGTNQYTINQNLEQYWRPWNDHLPGTIVIPPHATSLTLAVSSNDSIHYLAISAAAIYYH